ncbi:hypothetical protein BN2475_130080 [Paraburkholderia ribeironis]|uniref:Uncharacterized protein n=1 Tax=Paraburkholderia ribeironis TaxID=1247936 RepID=A0A1N7RSI0_9BURK|nr:hypothetical protein BN2475_130080 [Paraburkholderia ribeironis]
MRNGSSEHSTASPRARKRELTEASGLHGRTDGFDYSRTVACRMWARARTAKNAAPTLVAMPITY